MNMNYVEFCELVLIKLDAESDRDEYLRNWGIDTGRMEKLVWGEQFDELKILFKEQNFRYVLDDTVFDLEKLGLIEDGTSNFHKLSLSGRCAAKNLPLLWSEICRVSVPTVQENILKAVNGLTAHDGDGFARVEMISANKIFGALLQQENKDFQNFNAEDLAAQIVELRGRGLIFCERGEYPDEVRANYRGLVWEQKRDFIVRERKVLDMVEVWETTSVDFKRELYLDTAGEKAEFIKDIIGLANTQASGRRWLVVGFDDRTRQIHIPSEPPEKGEWQKKITQDRIEQLLSAYVAPNINVRFEIINFSGGVVGKLEIIREAAKLPYRVSKSLGDKEDKKRIEEGQIFVRHGSHTVQPDDEELQDLQDEAARAKSMS